MKSFLKYGSVILSLLIVGIGILLGIFGGVNELILGTVFALNRNYGYIYGGDPVVVKILNGKLEGFKSSSHGVSRGGRTFYEFLGIPFALPPVGNLRFEPPVPMKSWEGVRKAKTYASKCLQFDPFIQLIDGSEDCLFLNVFTPKLPSTKTNPKLPVIVFIHGGLFMFGRAEMFRPDYMIDEDLVLVSIHYRLGALGFLNTGDNQIRGNMGLKDQILALKWVQANIALFGGDPNSVTLLGQSAGAVSIHYHMLSGASKGLFHKAITMSGSALSHWGFYRYPRKQANIFANRLNCPTEDTEKMVSCLKLLSVDAIAPLYREADDRLAPRHAIFAPTLENSSDPDAVVIDSPRHLLEKGHIVNPVPWLNGVNSEEGLIYAFSMLLNQTCVEKINSDWSTYAPILFDYEDLVNDTERNEVSKQIRNYYMGSNPFVFGSLNIPQFVPIFSDSSFNLGLVESIKRHIKYSHDPIYLYYYAYQSEHGIAQTYFSMNGWLPLALDALLTNGYRWTFRNIFGLKEYHYGVCHCDELVMLFQFPYVLGRVTTESKDYEFSKKLVKIWYSFVKTGTPILPNDNVNWPKVQINRGLEYVRLDQNVEIIKEPFTARLKFWQKLLPHKNLLV